MTHGTVNLVLNGTRHEIVECNRTLERRLKVPIRVYKTVKAAMQMFALAVTFQLAGQGADPTIALAVVALIVGGPELFEAIVVDGPDTDDQN